MKRFLVVIVAIVLVFLPIKTKAADTDKYPASTCYEVEINDSRKDATAVTANAEVYGVIDADEDDFFSFTFPSDGLLNVTFSVLSNSNFSNLFYIYDQDGNGLFYGSTYGSVYKFPVLSFSKGTKLYFEVSRDKYSQYQSSEDYSIRFDYEDAKGWEIEDNNSRNSATLFTDKIYGTVLNTTDIDYYSFISSKHGYVSFDFKNEDGVLLDWGWNVKICDDALNVLEEQDIKGDTTFSTYISKKNTPIYIMVSSRSNNSQVTDVKFSITPRFKAANIETEKNDGIKDADKIKLNKVYCGTFTSSEDEDYFKFTAEKNGTYKVIFNTEYIDENYDAYKVSVLDSKKKEIKNAVFRENGALKVKVKKGKTYYLQVKSENKTYYFDVNSLYRFKINTK